MYSNKLVAFLIVLGSFFTSFSQSFSGKWYGNLNVGVRLPLIIHIQPLNKKKYDVTLDSPSQKAYGVAASETKVKKDSIFITFNSLSATYRAQLKEGELIGTFQQFGKKYDLKFGTDSSVILPRARPQTPKKPYPYSSKEVTFKNEKANITLAGTLTYPSSGTNFRAVILVSGSGPQDRNESMIEHEPFLVLSDYLTRNGIAVLRYDDRGVGASKGNFSTATTFDFASDAEAAVKFLQTQPNIDTTHIGVIGHSEGGMVAEIISDSTKGIVNFAILLAAPGIPLDELMFQQAKDFAPTSMNSDEKKAYLSTMQGLYKKIKAEDNCEATCIMDYFKNSLSDYTKNSMELTGLIMQLSTPWMQQFLKFEPKKHLEKMKLPILAVNGNKDMQVKAEENISAIRDGLKKAGNKDFTLKIYKDLNHLFQPCVTGNIDEYSEIETTFSEEVMEDISNWINDLK